MVNFEPQLFLFFMKTTGTRDEAASGAERTGGGSILPTAGAHVGRREPEKEDDHGRGAEAGGSEGKVRLPAILPSLTLILFILIIITIVTVVIMITIIVVVVVIVIVIITIIISFIILVAFLCSLFFRLI